MNQTTSDSASELAASERQGKPLVFATLDSWRGFAALWVVMYHGSLEIVSTRFPQLRHNPLFAFSIVGALGVQIFFVISGFCIANAAVSAARREHGIWRFLRARIRRIYPPYFFSLILVAGSSLAAAWQVSRGGLHSSQIARLSVAHHSLIYYGSQLTLTQLYFHQPPLSIVYWTLCYEIEFYLVVTCVLFITQYFGDCPRRLLDSLHLLTLLSLATLIAAPNQCPFPLNLWPQFGMGVLVFDLLGMPPARWRSVVAILTGVELAFFLWFRSYGGDSWHMGSRATFAVAAGFAVVLLLTYSMDATLQRTTPMRLMSFLGTFSYSLYLVHLQPMGIVMQLTRSRMVSPRSFTLYFVLEISVSVLAAYLFFWLFERPFLSRHALTRVTSVAEEVGAMRLPPSTLASNIAG